MNVNGNIDCAGNDLVNWWIDLDGTPVRSSVRLLGGGAGFSAVGLPPINLDGITATSIPAGAHTISVRGACTSGGITSTTQSSSVTGYVTVLDAGYAARTSPTAADSRAADGLANCTVTVTNGVNGRVSVGA